MTLLLLQLIKSKIPCLPGFTPVVIDTHAGAVPGGVVEVSSPYIPLFIKYWKVGNIPFSTPFWMIDKSPPSMPTNNIFILTKKLPRVKQQMPKICHLCLSLSPWRAIHAFMISL